MDLRRSHARLGGITAHFIAPLVGGMLWVLACSESPVEEEPAVAGPIVVISLSALPARLVGALGGEPGWTPELDKLAESTWHLRAVAHSSSPVPSLGSLLTGVDPWLHQVVSHRAKSLRADVVTLPEALGAAGWSTRAFFPLGYHFERHGFLDDFEKLQDVYDLDAAEQSLAATEGRQLTWIHLPDPGFPYVDRRHQIPRLASREFVAEKVERRWLMPFADPNADLSGSLLAAAEELYLHQVAWADQKVGRLIDALQKNPNWSETTLIVTALHGNELGAHDQVLFAQNLGRQALEVPLFIKTTSEAPRTLPEPSLVSTTRLAATILELAGLPPAAAQAPSLFNPERIPIPSALYDHDGLNRFSILDPNGPTGGLQLVWESRFAAEEPEFWAAQAIESGLTSHPIGEHPKFILRRLHFAFERTLPLSGQDVETLELRLVRWLKNGTVEPVQDPLMANRMAVELRRTWLRFIGIERTPFAERRYWEAFAEQQPLEGQKEKQE